MVMYFLTYKPAFPILSYTKRKFLPKTGGNIKKTRQSIIIASILSFVLIFTINAAAQQQTDSDFKSQAFDLAQQGDIAQMKALLDKHPEVVKAIDQNGVTPLHWAIAAGSAPVVELLLAKGADVNPRDNSHHAPCTRTGD
jgi:glycerol uptake facilitator-like aquaporin